VFINAQDAPPFPNGTIPAAPNNGGNSAATFFANVPCQNAADASIAGTAVAHQLLTQALQMTPVSDITAGMSLSNAQGAVTRALAYVGILATSASSQSPPTAQDLKPLNSALSAALVDVNLALADQRQQVGNMNLGNGADMLIGQIALIAINGPVILSQQRFVSFVSPDKISLTCSAPQS